jgi:protein SCO1/2
MTAAVPSFEQGYDEMRAPNIGLILTMAALAASVTLVSCGPGGPKSGGGQGESTGQALIGGPFQLIDQDGKPRDQSVLNGKWSTVFFGYTYCPDVCPTTLQVLSQAKAKLGDKAKDLQVVFVSIDPARDTPAQMKTYLSTAAFPHPSIGLTGTDAQVAAAAKAYKVYYAKQGTGEGYSMAHSSIVYLMNPKGQFDRVLTDSQTPDQVAAQLNDAMKGGS